MKETIQREIKNDKHTSAVTNFVGTLTLLSPWENPTIRRNDVTMWTVRIRLIWCNYVNSEDKVNMM